MLTNSPNNVFTTANAADGDTFLLDGPETSMTVGLSSSTMWAFGTGDTITAQGASDSVIYDRGTLMHVIVGADTTVSIDVNNAGCSNDTGMDPLQRLASAQPLYRPASTLMVTAGSWLASTVATSI